MQMALVLVTFFLFVSYASILVFYKKGWAEIRDFNFMDTNISTPVFISIIVPARNEEQNIVSLLKSLRQQSYPKDRFEIIVIDDHSTDNTFNIVDALKNDYIKIIDLKKYIDQPVTNSFKKKAIEIGVATAKGSLIVTTDADCTMSKNWLYTISAFYHTFQPKMIVMPVLIENNRSLLSIFQCLDFMCLQGITGAAVFKKWHGMANGANLAYTKQSFEEVKGFESIDHIASGDDFFLIQKMKRLFPTDIYYLKSKDAIVTTNAEKSLSSFLNQRIRWASKANKYTDKSLFPVLLLVYLFNLSLAVLFTFSILNPAYFTFFNKSTISILQLSFSLLFLKIIVELFFLITVARFFQKKLLLFWFPFFQPFHILYTITSGLFGSFGKYEWKGRRVR